MADINDVILGSLSEIHKDVREVRVIANEALAGVKEVQVEQIEVKRRLEELHIARKPNRWPVIAGVVSIGAAVARLVPGWHKQ
jgi:hypothetical protein